MKKIFTNIIAIFTLLLLVNCQEDEKSFGAIGTPSNLELTVDIVGKTAEMPYGDGSGVVKFSAKASNAISYTYVIDNHEPNTETSGSYTTRFTNPGLHTYLVAVVASAKGGITVTKTQEIEVLSNFTDPEAVQFLTGGTQKKWYWAAAEPGHLGVGQNDSDATKNYYANYYRAAPFEKAGSPNSSCLYENVMTFSLDGDQLKFELDNGGHTFFNTAFESVVGGTAGSDQCYTYDTTGIKNVSLSPSESVVMQNPDHATQTRGTMINIDGGGFMGYYIGQNSYEILSITSTRMVVRAVMGGNPALAWYHIFSTSPPTQPSVTDYTNLVFSDEFNVDGAPDPTKWGYDLGAGGWGNGEAETYTNSSDNVIVSGGNLKITAKSTGGSSYSSARIKSQGKYEFTYGKIEARAKMPTGGGTWPAIWALGANFNTNPWPACGEIDMMEHLGNNPNVIYGTLHYPGHSGGNANSNSTTIANASSDFHIYKAIWSPTAIQFYVDNVLYHSVANDNSLPFNSNFFLILNVAMGGNFGGNIDPAFAQSSMEVDYIRVYQ